MSGGEPLIGRPYQDPGADDDIGQTGGEPPRPEPPDEGDGLSEPTDERVQLGPEGIDDPETEWVIEEAAEPKALPSLSADETWLLIPGEELQVITRLPKPRQLPVGIAMRPGEVALCAFRRREWSRTPIGSSPDDSGLPMAQRLLVVFIRHRATGVRTKPRKYVIVTGDDGALLGWLDYSDAWNFEGGILKQMVDAVGLEYAIERYGTEVEFESAHPEWTR